MLFPHKIFLLYCTLLEYFDNQKDDGLLLLYDVCFNSSFAVVQLIEIYYIDCISSVLVKEVRFYFPKNLSNSYLKLLTGAKYNSSYR